MVGDTHMSKLIPSPFSPNIISDKELVKKFEEMIIANCFIDRHGNIGYKHQHSDNFHYVKQEILIRMKNQSSKTRKNDIDTPKDER